MRQLPAGAVPRGHRDGRALRRRGRRGKSAALVAEGIRACARYAGLRVLLVRRTYDELNESVFPALRKFGYAESLGARYNGSERELVFPNRSVFRFRYLESLDDASRRQGGEYQLLLVDELCLMAPGVVDILRYERLRAAGDLPVIGVRATSNPGGPSHGEVKARYIDSTAHGSSVVTDDHGLTVRFIQAKATDNPWLDAAYHARLASIPDPARRAAMRDGDWDQFAGMIFTEYRHERHTLDPIALPPSWKRYNGIDWGFAAPWAVLWGAEDPDKRIWVYRELYEREVKESDQARRILAAEAEDEHVAVRWADDSMWNLEGDAKPKSEMYAENGVYLTKAGKGQGSRITGWQRIHSYMAEMPACPHHRAQGWTTCPGIHIFRTCTNLLAELRSLPYARTGNPEDADPKAVDHACLAAGTLVETGRGPVPIERVTAGDSVRTREGLRRVTAAGMTARAAATGTVLMSDGTILRGTANHPVWVAGQGWRRLDALRYSDIISTWPAVRASYSTASLSGAIPTRSGEPIRCISPLAAATASAASGGFTRKYGSRFTGRSRTVITSITRMRTRSTTTRPTWNASPAAITSPSTWPSGTSRLPSGSLTWRRSGRSPRSGTGRKKAGNGTASTAGAHGMTAAMRPASARRAAPSTRRGTQVSRAPALITAGRSFAASRALTTRTGNARPAGRYSGSTSTPARSAARVRVARGFVADARPHDVYNLTVDGAHEFFANGVLVHNCDALRYLTVNLGGGPEFTILDTPEPNPVAEAVEPLVPLAQFAYRPYADDPDWLGEDRDPAAYTVRTVS